jgi:hypothetical protein
MIMAVRLLIVLLVYGLQKEAHGVHTQSIAEQFLVGLDTPPL